MLVGRFSMCLRGRVIVKHLMTPSARRKARSRLQPVDEQAVIRDYAAGVGIRELTEIHDVGLSRLYRILADHGVERRRPGQQRIGESTREQIWLEYRRGGLVAEIARRNGVSTSTVSNIGGAHAHRWPDRSREQLVDLIVAWFSAPSSAPMTSTQSDESASRTLRELLPSSTSCPSCATTSDGA